MLAVGLERTGLERAKELAYQVSFSASEVGKNERFFYKKKFLQIMKGIFCRSMQIAEKRLRGAFANFRSRGHMFEKYDSSSLRRTGGGGEYDVQVGVSNVWKNSICVKQRNL